MRKKLRIFPDFSYQPLELSELKIYWLTAAEVG
jgi:hypothetical protein